MQSPSTPKPVRLAHGLVENGRGQFLPVLSSALAQDILTRGYDARTLERVYANHPSGDLGLVGRIVDRVVLDLPVHQGLRERLDAAVGEICSAAYLTLRAGEPAFRLLSAPCGLGSELAGVAERLRARRPDVFSRLYTWGVDPDPDGRILPEAGRRTRAAGLETRFIREDLRRHREVDAVAAREGLFHLVSCIGLTQWYGPEETAELLRYYAGVLAPGGTLLMDRWEGVECSRVAAGLGVRMACQSPNAFHAAVRGAGLAVEREHPSGEGGCVLTVARKPR
jgi:hypothetical protein